MNDNFIALDENEEFELSKADILSKFRFLEAVFESIQMGILLLDSSRKVILSNNILEKILGPDASEILQQNGSEHLKCSIGSHNGCRSNCRLCMLCPLIPLIDQCMHSQYGVKGQEVQIEMEFLGQTIKPWLSVNGNKLHINSNQYLLLSLINISERKLLEDEAMRLAAMVGSSGDAIIAMDLEGTILNWNDGAEAMYGYAREQACGEHIKLIVSPQHQDSIHSFLQRIGQGELVQNLETRHATLQGREIDVSMTVSPIRNESGKVIGMSSITRNITERKKAQAELRAEKELLHAILSSIDEGLIAVDTDKNILLMNNIAESLTGYQFEEVEGRNIENILRVMDGKTGQLFGHSVLDRVLETDTTQAGADDAVLISQFDRKTAISKIASPIHNEKGETIGIILAIRDVTEQREIDRLKRDFISSVSHELRTPLTSIKAFTAMLIRDRKMPKATREKFMQNIDSESDRLSKLIEQLLDISRLESGTLKVDMEPTDILQIANQCLINLEPLAQKKNICLQGDLPDRVNSILCDSGKIESVIVNLINNAIKFTPENGKVALCLTQQEDRLVLEVRDNGMGIPEKDFGRIFQRFHRVERPGTQIQGTGLGLAIVYEIIKLHEGTIQVQSRLNEGSTFTVTLPYSPKGDFCEVTT